jgi:hypothetical protein
VAAWRSFLLLIKIALPPWTSNTTDPKHHACSAFVPWNSSFQFFFSRTTVIEQIGTRTSRYYPASCTVGTRSFPEVKSGRGVTLTPHPLIVPWSRKCGAIPLLSLWAVRPVQSLSACKRVHFTFTSRYCKYLCLLSGYRYRSCEQQRCGHLNFGSCCFSNLTRLDER